jgi:MED7 protein
MAQQPLSTPFPNPPDLYKSFTAKNVTELEELDAQHEQQHGPDEKKLRGELLPEHLRNLRPPTPPSPQETFVVFGEERTVSFIVSIEFDCLGSLVMGSLDTWIVRSQNSIGS